MKMNHRTIQTGATSPSGIEGAAVSAGGVSAGGGSGGGVSGAGTTGTGTPRRRWLTALALLAPAWVGCASIRPVDDVIRQAPVEGADASATDPRSVSGAPAGSEAGSGAGSAAGRDVGPNPGQGASSPAIPISELAPATLPTRPNLRAYTDTALDEFDRLCRELLEKARAEDAGYEPLMEAARALAFNADLRIQSDLAFRFDPADLPSPGLLIDAEDDVTGDLKGEVRSLARSSKDLADRALKLRDDDPGAWLFSTLGAGLFLWSLGPIEAVTSGGATTLPKKIRALAEAHPNFEGASPLRLKGRFQSRAPWPYKDKAAAVETLEKAVEVAPIPLNLVFLGDAYWINEQGAEAVAAWERATRADADQETMIAAPLLREIARLRVLSARR